MLTMVLLKLACVRDAVGDVLAALGFDDLQRFDGLIK